MIDLTKAEKDSIESALKPVGEYVAEIGMDRPLSNYSREEVLCPVSYTHLTLPTILLV